MSSLDYPEPDCITHKAFEHGRISCRGNPLWLPKIMGRHRGLPLLDKAWFL
jgi:hypothetical protein